MSLKEEVQRLFNRLHELTSESLRRFDKGLAVDDLKAEEREIRAKLRAILDDGLKGDFVIKDFVIDKTYSIVTITNDILVIPCTVRYKQVGLKDFGRKPGSKQVKQRIAELRECLSMQQLLNSNRYVVGVSYFEAQEGSYIVFSHSIEIAA
jgi:hypothetical protein